MKKNKSMRVASLLLALVLVTTCFVGATFAKYVSEASAEDTVVVAKWSFKVNGTEIAVTGDAPELDFNLFDTIKDSDGTAESDVASGKIAPGTSGSFSFSVENSSEVTADYTIAFKQTQANMPSGYTAPIKFYSDAACKNELQATEGVYTLQGGQLTSGSSATAQTVYWQWAYSTGAAADKIDTAIGIAAQTGSAVPSVTINTTVTATQVD